MDRVPETYVKTTAQSPLVFMVATFSGLCARDLTEVISSDARSAELPFWMSITTH